MADSNYDPNRLGSDTLPSANCDAPVARETAQDVKTAREAIRLHKIVNDLAEKGHK